MCNSNSFVLLDSARTSGKNGTKFHCGVAQPSNFFSSFLIRTLYVVLIVSGLTFNIGIASSSLFVVSGCTQSLEGVRGLLFYF